MRLRTRTKLMVQLAQDVISAEDNENYLLDQGYDSSPAPSLDVSFDIDDDLDGSFKDPTYVPSVSSLITKDGYNDIDCSPETSLKQDFANNEEIKNSPEREIKKIFYMNDGFNSNEKKYILDLPVANKSANKINIIDDVVLKKSCTGTNPVIDFADKLNSSRPSCNVSYVKKKKTFCKYCLSQVTNFERHLERNHNDCKEVIEMLSFPKKHAERKKIIGLIRNAGNFNEYLKGNLRPKYSNPTENRKYYPCSRCKALLTRNYLTRHKQKCVLKDINSSRSGENQLALSQTLIACSLDQNSTLHKLRVKEQVFSRMKPDEISMVAKTDVLIYSFGENYLKKHKRDQIISVCSNKMRELARFLIEFRKMTNNLQYALKDVLKPKLFDLAIECAKRLGGYDMEKKSYRSPSLSAHIGTSLKQVCDLLIRLVLKEDPSFLCTNREEILTETKRFQELIDSQWTTEISSLAFKDLREKQWEKPILLPLTRDITKFKEYVTLIANRSMAFLESDYTNKKHFKNLVQASLALTILFNRKRIGDVHYTKLTTYTESANSINQEECEKALTESEKILTKYYKRIVTGGKGSKPVAILFPPYLQTFIDFFLKIRSENQNIVPENNPYLFGSPGTVKWTRGDVVIRKFAHEAGLEYPDQISSNKLRKQIATVMQILNLNQEETEQFAQFMGHTEKTHNDYYRLPQDIYQTAKISKLLLLMERGVDIYKGKSLHEIDINPQEELAEEESENDDDTQNIHSVAVPNSLVKPQHKQHIELKSEIIGRTAWTAEQAGLVKTYFENNISSKKAPRKKECLELINKYPDVFYNKDWTRVKTFIYNIYRKK
ncbi:uncharacterized protein isoform X2 [Leptinotarsa decemlineata]|uniref:uncharacterized protein isoform X2 n=2 Tax=Leptinotarsa decemlineata TaxID=7539 RepID=UPI003D30823A